MNTSKECTPKDEHRHANTKRKKKQERPPKKIETKVIFFSYLIETKATHIGNGSYLKEEEFIHLDTYFTVCIS